LFKLTKTERKIHVGGANAAPMKYWDFFMVLFLFLLQWCIAPGAKKRNEKQK